VEGRVEAEAREEAVEEGEEPAAAVEAVVVEQEGEEEAAQFPSTGMLRRSSCATPLLQR
jgi:hypothetical protein